MRILFFSQKKRVVWLIASVLFCLMSSPGFATETESTYERVLRTGTLRCGYFVWPPYLQKDMKSGAFSGIYYDIIKSLGEVLNLKIEWSYEYTLGQQVEALKSGKVDALCADGPWTRSALPFIDYTHSYMFIPGYVYVSVNNVKDLTIKKLNAADYTFTAMDGDGSAEYLKMLFPNVKLLSLPSTADPSLLIENVITGKADALFSDPMTIQEQGANSPDKLKALSPEKPIATYPFIVSLPKGQQEMINMLNQGLDVLNDTGMIDKILKTHDPEGKKLIAPAQRYK